MGTKTKSQETSTNNVDELLDAPVTGQPTEEQKEALKAQIAELKAKEKELKAALKGEKVKKTRELKGEMVTFKNKAGDQITGLGVLYYVTRSNGKLHYKEASQVSIMTPEEVTAYNEEQANLVK